MSEAEIDALLHATDTEWTENLPSLSTAQFEELVALLPSLPERKQQLFKTYVPNIFRQACQSKLFFRSRAGRRKLSTRVAEELGTISIAIEKLFVALDGASTATKDILSGLPNSAFAKDGHLPPTDREVGNALAGFGLKAAVAARVSVSSSLPSRATMSLNPPSENPLNLSHEP